MEETSFRKTHDVIVLAGLLPVELADELDSMKPVVLQQWADDGRYPGDLPDATATEAIEVLTVASAIVAAMDAFLQHQPAEESKGPPTA